MKRNLGIIKYRQAIRALMLICIPCILFCGACGTQHPSEVKPPAKEKDLVPVNRFLVKKNEQNIENFIARKGWTMHQTPTGLWYMIYEKGKGEAGSKGKTISFTYNSYLLDGSRCYSSDSLGVKSFKIGNGKVESGLEEAALLLHNGDRARLILPPHLAFGLLGDNNKIPPQSPLLYDLYITDLK